MSVRKAIHDPRYLELVARLRSAREQSGISQTQLAARLGKPQSYISKVENGEKRLDIIETMTLCIALNIGLEQLLPNDFKRLLKNRKGR
jgi:transcriptional regulator with XRE-family HTH domain